MSSGFGPGAGCGFCGADGAPSPGADGVSVTTVKSSMMTPMCCSSARYRRTRRSNDAFARALALAAAPPKLIDPTLEPDVMPAENPPPPSDAPPPMPAPKPADPPALMPAPAPTLAPNPADAPTPKPADAPTPNPADAPK